MSRKRYVSTDISTDSKVRKLAEQSEFAAVLYTWMIPHAADDGTIVGDPDELLMLVVPGFRWRTADDVDQAVELMLNLGLMTRVDGGRLRFPPKAFYKAQSYIGADRRGAQPELIPEPPTTNGSAEPRVSAQIAATQKTALEPTQNGALAGAHAQFSSSSSLTTAKAVLSVSTDAANLPSAQPDDPVAVVYQHYRTRVQPGSRICPRKKITTRLKRFTPEQLIAGIDHFAEDWWRMKNNVSGMGADWFFGSDARAEQWLLLVPRAEPLPFATRNGHAPPLEAPRRILDLTGTDT